MFSGIGRSQGGLACTAVLLDLGGSASAPAYAVTNGHCTGWWDSHAVFEAQDVGMPAHVIFNYFVDSLTEQQRVPVLSVAYSTMSGTDLAVMELDATVGELKKAGLHPVQVADDVPPAGAAIKWVGAPLPTENEPVEYLRRGECTLGGTYPLIEFDWYWRAGLETNCADVASGASGSPLLNASGRAFALVNTMVEEPADGSCYLGQPCAILPSGVRRLAQRVYAMPIVDLPDCFAHGVIRLDLPSCTFERGHAAIGSPAPFRYIAQGSAGSARWSVAMDRDEAPFYRYKAGLAGRVDCANEEGYGAAVSSTVEPRIDSPIGDDEGIYLLCVETGDTADLLAAGRNVTVFVAEVDGTPPPLPLPVLHNETPDGGQFHVKVIHPTYERYRQKSGPAQTTDCSSPEGYERVNERFGFFGVPRAAMQTRVCVVAHDWAGLRSEPQEWLLPGTSP